MDYRDISFLYVVDRLLPVVLAVAHLLVLAVADLLVSVQEVLLVLAVVWPEGARPAPAGL